MPHNPPNTFFDINKLPPHKGLLVFGLSMNQLHNKQSPDECLAAMRHFSPSKVNTPTIGCVFLYSDNLYYHSNTPAHELKNKFTFATLQHKNALQKRIHKNNIEFQIQDSFSYTSWMQLSLGTKNFDARFTKLKTIYKNDAVFQKYIEDDCALFDKTPDENQVNFFLEEIIMFYLLTKNKIEIQNNFIQNEQKWILFCYPGRPLKSTVYVYQQNFFELNWDQNPYQNAHYDLIAKQLIKYDDVDLDTYSVK